MKRYKEKNKVNYRGSEPGRKNRYNMDLTDFKSLEDLESNKRERLKMKDDIEASFKDLMENGDFYFFIKTFIDRMLENTGGDIPKRMDILLKKEFNKALYKVIMDVCGSKKVAYNVLGMHKYALDQHLKECGIYDDYSEVGNNGRMFTI